MFSAIKALLGLVALLFSAAVVPGTPLSDGISGENTLCVQEGTAAVTAEACGSEGCPSMEQVLPQSDGANCAGTDLIATCSYTVGSGSFVAYFSASEGGTCASAEATCDALGGVAHCR